MVMPWAKDAAPAEASLERSRVAILPFRNMSSDPGDEYFAEGMTEEIISTVSKIRELTVISRTSVMRYRNLSVPIGQIGQELKVGSVLEGSVRKAGNKIRITAQLIDVKSDGHLWSQSYDKELADVFAIQGDIAEQIAGSLKVQLLQGERRRIRGQPTTDLAAYTLYLKGRHFWFERTEENTKKALQYFQEAVKLDPTFAMAYSGIADCYSVLSDYLWMPPAEALPLAKASAMKALEADDSLAEAHASLGLVLADYDWDLGAAEREFRRAIDLKPNYAIASHWLSVLLFHMRRYEESAELERRCLELDPYSRLYNMVNTNVALILGKAKEAAERYEALVEAYPDFGSLWFWKSTCHMQLGQYEMAIQAARKFLDTQGNNWFSRLHMALVNAAAGNVAEAEKTLSEAVAASQATFVGPANIAHVMLKLGRKEEGYAWLERAYRERDPQLLYFNGFPWTRVYREDPRWAAIEAQFGFKSAPG
jgi:adenylate cyclase